MPDWRDRILNKFTPGTSQPTAPTSGIASASGRGPLSSSPRSRGLVQTVEIPPWSIESDNDPEYLDRVFAKEAQTPRVANEPTLPYKAATFAGDMR